MFKFKAPGISWNEAYFHVRRSEHEMKRNAEIGLFTKPLKLSVE